MQSVKKPVDKKTKPKEKPKEEILKASDEKLKKNTYNATTPRDFMQRSSAADIYAQKRKTAIQKTPKKVPGTSSDNKASPMKDLLKSTPSSISQISNSSRFSTSSRVSSKLSPNVRTRTAKDLPFVNVTVNSPVAKRKLDLNTESARVKESPNIKEKTDKRLNAKDAEKQNTAARVKKEHKEVPNDRGDFERQRSKTRTLNENEVKLLTPDRVDNNEEMMNLKQKLVAKPKAFYVDLDGDSAKTKNDKTSDEDVSYEDDFESYESDFDSYHSDRTSVNTSEDIDHDDFRVDEGDEEKHSLGTADLKEGKDEESMLDSGSFDLREQRSANKSKPTAMEFITEAAEDREDTEDKVSSLDEGFQEGPAGSSMRTVHVDKLERPLFIDFKKSKEKKRKKRVFEQMMQRAKDILSMVTLHEMSFTLCEMKPISYDLYMAIFGRTNYTQISVQTFEDGITEEVQTDEVAMDCKWTQFPVKFSKYDVYLNDNNVRKNNRSSLDFLTKFTSLLDEKKNDDISNDLETLKNYKENPLRVLLEQKNGVGNCEMLPYETYNKKLSHDFSINRLGRLLKKVEGRVSNVLNYNAHGSVLENVIKSSFPFSTGYVSITTKNVSDEKSFLKTAKITSVIFSDSKNNLILTVHAKSVSGVVAGKCILCLWDTSVARAEPIKMLIAIDSVVMGRFRGATDGILVAALEDGSMHLWDLSEQPGWRNDVTSTKKEALKDVKDGVMTQTERDREWNVKNSNAGYEQLPLPFALQACAYTSSAGNLGSKMADSTVGLEFAGGALAQDGGRKVLGQVCSLQRLGVLTIWTIIQEKIKTHDVGKAYWSKMKLEKSQTFSLTDHVSAKELIDNSTFNLSAAKKRMSNRKQEKILARNFSRQKSADSCHNDRPASVATPRKLPVEKTLPHEWETGIVCSDLKIVHYNNTDRYLVAKNNGEVLSCTRSLGAFKVERFCVASDTSSITCLDVSPHASAYFLAATDSGTVHLYSMLEARVLLTLDSSNASQESERPQADIKGRFVGDAPKTRAHGGINMDVTGKVSVLSVWWSRVDPCRMLSLSRAGSLALWELTQSDIHPKYVGGRATFACMAADGTLALVTPEGEVQAHRMQPQRIADHLQLFHKYVALL